MAHLSLLGASWPVSASAATLTMNNGVLQIIDAIAFILMGFSLLLPLVFPDLKWRRSLWIYMACCALAVVAVGGYMLDMGIRELSRGRPPFSSFSPFPEIVIATLAISVILVIFQTYRLLRRRARYLEAARGR